MLNELDRELERQGLRFVRYADDFSIYVKTKTDARKVGNNIYKFLKQKLKLSINREKSGIRRPVHFTCLGFGFVPTYKKGERASINW
jgi:retron-type reverse transcriptase